MKKLKEYRCMHFIRGIQLHKVGCALSLKHACESLDTTAYQIKNYGGIYAPPKIKEAKENPYQIYVVLDEYGGELAAYDAKLRGKVMRISIFEN